MPPRLEPHVLTALGEALRASFEEDVSSVMNPELTRLAAELDRALARARNVAAPAAGRNL